MRNNKPTKIDLNIDYNTKIFKVFVTLTSGISPHDSAIDIKEYHSWLMKLLKKSSDKLNFKLYLEFLDKQLRYTKFHYHGIIEFNYENVPHFTDFIKKYENKKFIDIQIIKSQEEYDKVFKYCTKLVNVNKTFNYCIKQLPDYIDNNTLVKSKDIFKYFK